MKKSLATALGALLAAASAAPATAAAHIDFTGYYRVMYNSETNTGYGRESGSFTDSYVQDRLNLELAFRPTDEVSVYWRLRGPSSYQRWGGGDKNLETHYIYGEIRQSWGAVLIGRLNDDLDVYGLASLGYQPGTVPIFTNVGPFDRADIVDGIRYCYDWDNGFSIMAQYGKLDNNGQNGGQVNAPAWPWEDKINGSSDQDYDRWQVEGTYAWDGGGASLGLFYDRNASRGSLNNGYALGYGTGQRTVVYNNTRYNAAYNKVETWGLNPAIMHSWGDFSIHFEGMAVWGQAEFETTYSIDGRKRRADIDGQGYGAYLDFDYNYGPGNATLGAWWVSGSDLDELYNSDGTSSRSPESDSLADLLGGNFYPLLVAYNGANINPSENRYHGNSGRHISAIGFANNAYNNYVRDGHVSTTFLNDAAFTAFGPYTSENALDLMRAGSRTRTVSFNEGADANHWAIALTGNHAFTDDVTMHYGLAYLALNKPNYRVAESAEVTGLDVMGNAGIGNFSYTTQDKDLGFEIDLGFTFQLLDNLSFTTAFGYMVNGDAYKQLKGYNWTQTVAGAEGTMKAVWEDADDSYVWFNSLTFSF